MTLRKEWREAVHTFIHEKWKDAFEGRRKDEIQDLTYNDLALRLQALADEERREDLEKIACLMGYCRIWVDGGIMPSELPAVVVEAADYLKSQEDL